MARVSPSRLGGGPGFAAGPHRPRTLALRNRMFRAGRSPRIFGGGDLSEIALIEQRQLQWTSLGEFLDLRCAQAGDPIEAGGPQVFANARRGDHAAVANQHYMPETDALLQLIDLCRQGAGIAGVTGEYLDGNRPAIAITQQAADDPQPVRAMIAVHMGDLAPIAFIPWWRLYFLRVPLRSEV